MYPSYIKLVDTSPFRTLRVVNAICCAGLAWDG